jgi:hypothetical protein
VREAEEERRGEDRRGEESSAEQSKGELKGCKAEKQ